VIRAGTTSIIGIRCGGFDQCMPTRRPGCFSAVAIEEPARASTAAMPGPIVPAPVTAATFGTLMCLASGVQLIFTEAADCQQIT
jgi:hypothetical protein